MTVQNVPSAANDFGGKLRQARERRGISLRQIAASTKIAAAALEALERNDISKLPGGIFSRAFVRSYAVEVGLNPDETVKEFLDRFPEDAPAPAPPPAAIPEEESNFEARQRMASLLLKIVLVTIVLAGVLLYLMFRSQPAASGAPIPAPQPFAFSIDGRRHPLLFTLRHHRHGSRLPFTAR